MATQIKSPYNFVPAVPEDKVYKPEWANQVSHDIPLRDGESGEIEITLKAETPIFIRNGHAKGDTENEFSNIEIDGKKRYFIPASSIKGMLRNVIEVLTKSRLNKNLVNDDRYSFRDLSNGSLYLRSYDTRNVKGGWLKEKENGSWEIEECEHICHIHHAELDKALDLGNNGFRQLFLGINPVEKTAKYKYTHDYVNGKSLISTFLISQSEDGFKSKAIYDAKGNLGTIVFTGQSSRRNENGPRPSGKVNEFVFFASPSPKIREITPIQQKNFKFIYSDHDKENISPDWKFWKEKLEKGEKVPVFFNKQGDEGVKHFGLSFMYKLPYAKSVHQMLPITGYTKKFRDFAETLFGYAENNDALKGRLFIGNAISENATSFNNTVSEIMGSPKASYFPFYLEQLGNTTYNTYQDETSLRGYKRYPVRNNIRKGVYTQQQMNNKRVFNQFIPLNAGALFSGKIRFHNLQPIEIGALISAISFHNSDHCFHSMGLGKAFGYGKVKVEIVGLKNLKKQITEYLYDFEKAMGINWYNSEQVKELVAMASNQLEDNLNYPTLNETTNEFVQIKKEHGHLNPYSTVNQQRIKSIISKFEAENAEKKAILLKQQNEFLDKKAESLLKSENLSEIEDFVNKNAGHSKTSELRQLAEKIRSIIKLKKSESLKNQVLVFDNSSSYSLSKVYLNNMLKKNKGFSFSSDQIQQIINMIDECWKHDNNVFFKKKKLANLNEYPWTEIKKWIGEEKTNELYYKFTKG